MFKKLYNWKSTLSAKRRYRVLRLVVFTELLFLIVGFSAAEEEVTGSRLAAFVASVSEYPGSAALFEAEANASVFGDAAKSIGAELTAVKDFSKKEFFEKFRSWLKTLDGTDVAMVYFCGYGGSWEGENYLFPFGTDLSSPSDMEEECIAVRPLLEELADTPGEKPRLVLFFLDGTLQNPFLSPLFGVEDASSNLSAFYSLANLPEGTAVIHPAQSGELVPRKHFGKFAHAIRDHLFEDGVSLKAGLSAVRESLVELSEGTLEPTFELGFTGQLVFHEASSSQSTFLSMKEPSAPETQESPGGLLWVSFDKAHRDGDFEKAVSTLLEIKDNFPKDRDRTVSEMKKILTSQKMENPFEARALIQSEKFSLERLASPEVGNHGGCLDLAEARRLAWNSGRWFPELRETAMRWAKYDAEKGVAEAMGVYGEFLYESGSSEGVDRALEWFRNGVKEQNPRSHKWLGQLYLNDGNGVEQDLAKAEEHFKVLQEKGDPVGSTALGFVALKRGDLGGAMVQWRSAIEGGDYVAATFLGPLLFFPEGRMEKEKLEGLKLLLEASEEGVQSKAMYALWKAMNTDWAQSSLEARNLISEEKAENFLKASADLHYPSAVKKVIAKGDDFFEAARPLCEKVGLTYDVWKLDQKEKYKNDPVDQAD